jgi:glycosyltransferase involved in cell wall biosynthesis
MSPTVGVNARTFTVEEPGGAVQSAIRHTRGLIKDPTLSVVLFGHDSLVDQFPETAIVNARCPTRSQTFGIVWERTVLPHLADSAGVDLLYCPNGNAPVIKTSYPVVMCVHDVNAMKGWSSGIHQMYRRVAIPTGARVADVITTVSEFSKSEIIDNVQVNPSMIEVVYNGVDEIFHSDGDGDPVELPEQYLLFVGSLNPRKNIEGVVRSFLQLKQRSEIPHDLVVIGPDNKSIFKRASIEDRDDIVTPGFLSKMELKHAYANADVFVFPSFYEGFGLPPLEALACGTPVVASETTSLGELLDRGCIKIDPADVDEITAAVRRILIEDDLAETLVREGAEYASKFTWDETASQLSDIFHDCVQGGSTGQTRESGTDHSKKQTRYPEENE